MREDDLENMCKYSLSPLISLILKKIIVQYLHSEQDGLNTFLKQHIGNADFLEKIKNNMEKNHENSK